jgi:hypothetical protein
MKTQEVVLMLQDVIEKIRTKGITTEDAMAVAAQVRETNKILDLRIKHAKLTGRLEHGSDKLPDFEM